MKSKNTDSKNHNSIFTNSSWRFLWDCLLCPPINWLYLFETFLQFILTKQTHSTLCVPFAAFFNFCIECFVIVDFFFSNIYSVHFLFINEMVFK